MSFNIGENIGPYRILEQLGQGGMATVFKAYHASLDRYVALKVLHPAFHQDISFTTRFQREARVIAKLEHPNIVPIYDYAEHEARPYLVMKYIEGDTLKARLNQGPLTSKEIEDVVNSIGSALAYAHKQGILHRDVKPSNVMIANDGTMYLADFGLARIAEAGESTMSSDSIMGTPQYISPEQAMGKKDLDAGTDIYSFGVMLYEMVVGQVPFSADTPFSIIHDHIYTPLPLPQKVNPKVPESVQRVLLKALAKDRLDRYENTEDLVKAFKDAWTEAGVPMQGTAITMRTAALQNSTKTTSNPQTPIPEKKPAVIDQPKAKKKTSPWMWVSIGLIALFCFAFAFVVVRNNNRQPRPPQSPGISTIAPVTQPTTAPAIQPTDLPSPTPQGTTGGTPPIELIDDFESTPPLNTSGWEAYFQEDVDAKIKCEANPEFAHSGTRSLLFDFDLPAQSWATCGFYYDRIKDWSSAPGISFYMRTNLRELVFDIALYSGATDNRSTYVLQMKAPPGSEADWTPVKIHWEDVLRAEWEDNPGTPFPPAEVTGFSIGFSGSTPEQLTGSIWLDDLALIGEPDPAFGSNIPEPTIRDAMKLVEQNPNDPNAHLQLSIALWDAKQARQAMDELTQALNLAGSDNTDFLITAADEFKKREAWAPAMNIYIRLASHYETAGGMPEEIKTNFHEAVYKSSQVKEPQSLDVFTRIDAIDPQLGHIARGRQALFGGNIQEAKSQLAEAEKVEPLIPEIFLLKMEIALKEGNTSDAKYIIDNTINNPATPEWIRFMMENYLKGMQ